MNRHYKNIVTLDFETYFDADYTLRKLTNTSYIRHGLFKVQGVGIKKDTWKTARWFKHSDVQRGLALIDWSNAALLCHHTHFDGLILSHHYGIVPAYYMDTLSMARPLHGGEIRNDLNTLATYYGLGNKLPDILSSTKGVRDLARDVLQQLGTYCVTDVDLTEALFWRMRHHYPEPEMDLIHHTVRLFCDPICKVNKTIATAEHKKEVQRRETTVASVPYTATQLRSRKQFPEILLNDYGIHAPTKLSPTTGKQTFAFAKTDQKWIDLQNHPDESVRLLCEAKALVSSNINETRALRLLEHADPSLPIYLNYGKAHTFRWTGGDKMNPQNFPRDSQLRHAICAPRGHKFVIVDSAQIEARVNAWLAGQEDLIAAFAKGDDIYTLFAAENIYHKDPADITKTERFVGKVCILGLGYQMGAAKFKYTLNIGAMGPPVFLQDDFMYQEIVTSYRFKYRAIKDQWRTMEGLLTDMRTMRSDLLVDYGPLEFEQGKVLLPNGLYMRYPNLRLVADPTIDYPDRTQTIYNQGSKIYGGLLTENIVQALARIVVADQILRIAWKYRTVLMVHDEVILCVPTSQAKKALKDTLETFHTPPLWAPDLPVAGEGGVTDYYQKL